jgi:ornithine cyclodeaminase
VLVVGRSAERAESFVASLRARFPGATIERAGAREAVSAANVVVAATNSTSPVLASDWVGPGTHVNGIGSFRADMCELDPALLGRATVIVDQRDAARKSGELDAALRMGLIDGATITEIGQVGEHARKSTDEITVFKSVGHAALDLFTATEVLRRATLERA